MLKRFMVLTALVVGSGCGQVDPDDHAPLGSQYGRSDDWYVDSSGNWQQIVNGSETGTYLSSGGNLVVAGTLSSTGAQTIGAGVAATDYTLTINGETNDCVFTCMEDEARLDVEGNLQFGTGAAATDYTLTADGETNDGTLTWKEDEDVWAFTEAVKTPTPMMGLKVAYFCGNGANATTAVYMPPVIPGTEAADGSTYEYGEAGCDGLDNTTETSGDDYIQGNGALAISIVGMACGISAAGTDDTYTFQLRDDAADVTGVTCNVTLDGSIQECTVLLDTPVVMAAGSLAAVENVASTDDDVSSADVECVVFYTYAF